MGAPHIRHSQACWGLLFQAVSAPLLRGMYARQLDGFGQEQPQPSVKFPVFHSETVAVYPGDKNNLPYDVVVEIGRAHVWTPVT